MEASSWGEVLATGQWGRFSGWTGCREVAGSGGSVELKRAGLGPDHPDSRMFSTTP